MEYGPENNTFVLKMMMKSGLEKIILKFLHAQSLFWKIFFTSYKGGFLHQIANSVIDITCPTNVKVIKYVHITYLALWALWSLSSSFRLTSGKSCGA